MAVTTEQTNMMLKWQDAIMQVSKQITAAEIEYRDAATVRLERKHKLEELRSRLQQLCDEGPYGDSGTPNLFTSTDEPSKDSIRLLSVPARIITILEKANITTMSRLHQIVNGTDSDYDDLDCVSGLDTDAVNRILGILNDQLDDEEDDSPRIVPYEAPLTQAAEPAAPKNTEGLMKIRVLVDNEDAGLSKGQLIDAIVPDSGEAVYQMGDETILLESTEFELVS